MLTGWSFSSRAFDSRTFALVAKYVYRVYVPNMFTFRGNGFQHFVVHSRTRLRDLNLSKIINSPSPSLSLSHTLLYYSTLF